MIHDKQIVVNALQFNRYLEECDIRFESPTSDWAHCTENGRKLLRRCIDHRSAIESQTKNLVFQEHYVEEAIIPIGNGAQTVLSNGISADDDDNEAVEFEPTRLNLEARTVKL